MHAVHQTRRPDGQGATGMIAIIGGLGHVGLPLGLVLADCGFRVAAIDSSPERLAAVRQGRMPFLEHGAEALLNSPNLTFHEAPGIDAIQAADIVIVTLGTPLDEYQNPKLSAVLRPLLNYGSALDGKLLILRSTLFPGTTARIAKHLPSGRVAFCPERILQGHAVRELRELPQIVSGVTEEAAEEAAEVFAAMGVAVVKTSVASAELAKLFLNAWRYISFAAANQFLHLANELGVDYNETERAMKDGYARADALPSPGFAAGPCLLKDTMQLVAASPHGFPLGMAARLVNERVPDVIVAQLRNLHGPLDGATIGILGMAFKADNDDTRDSLSFKLKKQLEFAGAVVLCSDEHAEGKGWVTMGELVGRADAIVVAVGHREYRGLKIPDGKVVVDLFGVTSR